MKPYTEGLCKVPIEGVLEASQKPYTEGALLSPYRGALTKPPCIGVR